MTEQISELQSKRAANLIWNAAGRHGFTPDYKAYDKDGLADVYWNSIIGAAHKHYDYAKFEKLFDAFRAYEDGDVYEGLLWLGLENCVYRRELRYRPALEPLRRKYAEALTGECSTAASDDYRLYDHMALAHYARVLGREPEMSVYDKKLLDELEFSPEMSTEEIVAKAEELFTQWFQIRTEERKKERKERLLHFGRKRNKHSTGRGRRSMPLGFLMRSGSYGGEGTGRDMDHELHTKLSAAELREFMAEKYGRELFSQRQIMELEKRLCTGNHKDCHLHFTKGEPVSGTIKNGFEALQKTKEAAQIERNRQAYQAELSRNRLCVSRLAGKLQNSILLHLHPTPVKSNSGRVNAGTIWRAVELNDDKVFISGENGDMGELSVDILLDASTSQRSRQETVSNQGYIIAEALTRCSIPCRVMSFCSMTGYTILRVFRDYNDPKENERIFEYVSNGCNRDGLAIRAARSLMNESGYEHKILIVLSDVKPNDIVKMPDGEGEMVLYERQAGIKDTAAEVRLARADGIAVVCVFTGEDDDLPAARTVYGRDFARIQSLDKFADTVGMLIQNQIRNI